MKLLIMQSLPVFYNLVHLRPIHLPQNPIIRHPQHAFFPQHERASLTPVKNKSQNCSSLISKLTYKYYTKHSDFGFFFFWGGGKSSLRR